MENIIIRKAYPEEAERLIDINIKVWNTTYNGLIPQEVIDKLQSKNLARIERNKKSIKEKNNIFVAEIDGKIIGYSTYGKTRDENYTDAGEIYAGYILDDYQKLGIGRKLAVACMEEMIKNGYTTLITKCLKGNPSNEFHKSLGGEFVGQSTFEPLGIYVGIENIYYHNDLLKSLKYNKDKIEYKNISKWGYDIWYYIEEQKYHPELSNRINIIKKEIKNKSRGELLNNIKYFK